MPSARSLAHRPLVRAQRRTAGCVDRLQREYSTIHQRWFLPHGVVVQLRGEFRLGSVEATRHRYMARRGVRASLRAACVHARTWAWMALRKRSHAVALRAAACGARDAHARSHVGTVPRAYTRVAQTACRTRSPTRACARAAAVCVDTWLDFGTALMPAAMAAKERWGRRNPSTTSSRVASRTHSLHRARQRFAPPRRRQHTPATMRAHRVAYSTQATGVVSAFVSASVIGCTMRGACG